MNLCLAGHQSTVPLLELVTHYGYDYTRLVFIICVCMVLVSTVWFRDDDNARVWDGVCQVYSTLRKLVAHDDDLSQRMRVFFAGRFNTHTHTHTHTRVCLCFSFPRSIFFHFPW